MYFQKLFPLTVFILHPAKVKVKYQHFGEGCFLTHSYTPKMQVRKKTKFDFL